MSRKKSAPRIVQKRDRFKELRILKGYTQRSLSIHLDVHESYIRELESGRANPEIGFAFRIAKCFDSTVDDVFQDLAN